MGDCHGGKVFLRRYKLRAEALAYVSNGWLARLLPDACYLIFIIAAVPATLLAPAAVGWGHHKRQQGENPDEIGSWPERRVDGDKGVAI